ncbi:MAG: SDR family oxidoreductase [Pseudomonadota bacterium]
MAAKGAAFITGGSSGIGLALARDLAAAGHGIALLARDKDKLFAAMRALKAAYRHIQVTTYTCDVGDRADVERAVAAAILDHGPPEWAIANAGIAKPGLFLDQPIEAHEAQMRTNYMGALYFARAAASQMAGGNLVFVSSGAAFFGIYGYSAYAPSKFALRGLAEVLRVELAPQITVTLAYPPDTDTPQLVAESRTKPATTKEITAGAGVWSADKVADVILRRARAGKFVAAPGVQMTALAALHSLAGPMLRRWQLGIAKKHR